MKNTVRPNAFADLGELRGKFVEASPFPHLVIDDFLKSDVANRIHDEARQTASNVNASNDITQKKKIACTDWSSFGKETYKFISYLNSSEFISNLEAITGIDGLIGDPHLEGGGIHQTSAGGFLKMHTDFNWNAKLRADRRINILFYLNKNWMPEFKGELLLSSLDQKAMRTVEPIFNRLVIFNTNDTSLHGHPEPLQFPAEYPRTSIAMYYYSTGAPVKERWRRRATTTRYVPLSKGDIRFQGGSWRSWLGYVIRRFTSF